MKFKLSLVALATMTLVACTPKPTVNNYVTYMNAPPVKSGDVGSVNNQVLNKSAWNSVAITQMTSIRKLPDGSYTQDQTQGVLTVRAVLVNSAATPVQGNWRCKFYDSNNLPLDEDATNQMATTPDGLGWHTMVVFPVDLKSQTDQPNVINCKATTPLATNYRIEFHDTANDITIYKQ